MQTEIKALVPVQSRSAKAASVGAGAAVSILLASLPAFAVTTFTTDILGLVTELVTLATAVVGLVLSIKAVAWGLSVLKTIGNART